MAYWTLKSLKKYSCNQELISILSREIARSSFFKNKLLLELDFHIWVWQKKNRFRLSSKWDIFTTSLINLYYNIGSEKKKKKREKQSCEKYIKQSLCFYCLNTGSQGGRTEAAHGWDRPSGWPTTRHGERGGRWGGSNGHGRQTCALKTCSPRPPSRCPPWPAPRAAPRSVGLWPVVLLCVWPLSALNPFNAMRTMLSLQTANKIRNLKFLKPFFISECFHNNLFKGTQIFYRLGHWRG